MKGDRGRRNRGNTREIWGLGIGDECTEEGKGAGYSGVAEICMLFLFILGSVVPLCNG